MVSSINDKHNEAATNDRYIPDIKVYGANMGPTWGRQEPGGPHVGPISGILNI